MSTTGLFGRRNDVALCGTCGVKDPDVECTVCRRRFHGACVPTRTSRSGLGIVCRQCAPPPASRAASYRSTNSQLDLQRLEVAKKKICVRRQLLSLRKERLEGKNVLVDTAEAPPPSGTMPVAVNAPLMQQLQVPSFQLNGQVNAASLAAGERRTDNNLRQSALVIEQQRIKEEELLLMLEELNLKDEELQLTMQEPGIGPSSAPRQIFGGSGLVGVSKNDKLHATAVGHRPDETQPEPEKLHATITLDVDDEDREENFSRNDSTDGSTRLTREQVSRLSRR